MLRLWRERNRWTQYTVERWGREAGFATLSSATVSMVEQGKAGDLRSRAYFQLADVNQRLVDRDWGELYSPELRQALEGAEPIRGEDGALWGPAEFWCCYVGLLPVPAAYRHLPPAPAPALDGKKAAELSALWRQQVSDEASRRGLDPIETLQGASRQAPAAERKTLRAVLAGFRDYRPEELRPLWQQGWLPEAWIEAWQASLAEAAEEATASSTPQAVASPAGKGKGKGKA